MPPVDPRLTSEAAVAARRLSEELLLYIFRPVARRQAKQLREAGFCETAICRHVNDHITAMRRNAPWH